MNHSGTAHDPALCAEQDGSSPRIMGTQPGKMAAQMVGATQRFSQEIGQIEPDILDFGSGLGGAIPSFRSLFPQSQLTCADISSDSNRAAQMRWPGPERFILLNGNHIPTSANQFDLAYSALMFQHIRTEAQSHWLLELWRVTRPGGALVLFEHNPASRAARKEAREGPYGQCNPLIPPAQLRTALTRIGWGRVTLDYLTPLPARLKRWLGTHGGGRYYRMTARKA